MLFKTKRRAIITFVSLLILILYFSRSLSILIPFSVTVLALLLFRYIDKSFKFNFPDVYYVYVFAIFVLGTIIGPGTPPFGLYYREIFYDKMLHTLSPFLISAIMFFILNRLDITLRWKLVMTVGLVFGILGIFEIGEYLSDVWFGTLNQGVYFKEFVETVKVQETSDPLTDTMSDLIFGLFGSLAYIGYKVFRYHFPGKNM